MRPGEYHDAALPCPRYEGLFGTIYCSRCGFFGLGYNHPEWCQWQWLEEAGYVGTHLDIIEVGERVATALGASPCHSGRV